MPQPIVLAALALALAIIIPASVYAAVSSGSDAPAPAETAPTAASEDTSNTETIATAEDGEAEKTAKPWVGLYVMNVNDRLADKLDIDAEEGVVVVKVVEDGPADDAGIESGDVIVSISGSDIETVSDVRAAVTDASVGNTLAFTVQRDGSASTYNVTVGERPAREGKIGSKSKSRSQEKSGSLGSAGIGATIASLNADLAEKLEIETEEGVVVLSVRDGSPADDAGLQKGDVIVSVDGETVDGISDVTQTVRGAEVGDTLTITVDREGENANLSLSVTVEEGYGFRGMALNLRGLGNIRGTLSDDEEGPVSIMVSKVTVASVVGDSVTLTPTEAGNDDITATVTDNSVIFKDGENAEASDLAVDDEGYAVVVDGDLKLLFIGSLDDVGRGHFRFGRFGGGDGDDSDSGRAFRRGGRGFGSGAFTLPPGPFGGRDFLGPLNGFGSTLQGPAGETTT